LHTTYSFIGPFSVKLSDEPLSYVHCVSKTFHFVIHYNFNVKFENILIALYAAEYNVTMYTVS